MSGIRLFITTSTAIKIYKTMIRPHVEYVDFVIESGSKSIVSKLDRLQERALRKIENCNRAEIKKTYGELEIQYRIEPLKYRRSCSLLRQMYYQSQIEINIMEEKCERTLRSSNKINMRYKFSNLTKLHNSPYYRGAKLWNTLPERIQKCKIKLEFKRMVRDWTKTMCIMKGNI